MRKTTYGILLMVVLFFAGCAGDKGEIQEDAESLQACAKMAKAGFRPVADHRKDRFLGKVAESTARCRGGEEAVTYRETPWVDWSNYWAAGDARSQAPGMIKSTGHLSPNGRGIDGTLLDLEYARIELIKFNLFDNQTFRTYIQGSEGVDGPAVKVWKEMRLPQDHPKADAVGGHGPQLCTGQLIRNRTLTGICNDMKNPLMGSTNQPFARNVQFESTFPRLGRTELIRNRHGQRLGLLKPDPQVISRTLFTRSQSQPDNCQDGQGLEGFAKEAHCDYQKAPFFNVLAAFWIQFMTHDWFSHLEEGHNQDATMEVGCVTHLVDHVETPLTSVDVIRLGCRPGDRIEKAIVAEDSEPDTFVHEGTTYQERAPKTFPNTVTAWWDASQIYGYDVTSRQRVKRDPKDPAKLLMVQQGTHAGAGEQFGYLPVFETCPHTQAGVPCTPDPINPAWGGQEAAAFPDNWSIGLSFYHNLFTREHNAFVLAFRAQTAQTPEADSGLRNPARPHEVIGFQDVTPDELFEVARLVVSAEIAKIHTIEWTPQLLYNEPLYKGMNANWSGLFADHPRVTKALAHVTDKLSRSTNVDKATQWYSVFASGPGIVGLGSQVYEDHRLFAPFNRHKKDIWDLTNPDHVNGGINQFGSPFNFPEEFTTVYRLHPLLPDLIEYREWDNDPNVIGDKIPVVKTFRGLATEEMRKRGVANIGLSMGRQPLGLLTLHNHAQFLQNLHLRHLQTPTQQIDVAALDLIRDRERGIPRFNEFRRQYGLKSLKSFNDFIDQRQSTSAAARKAQETVVQQLREVYGQHTCDASKVITVAQVNEDGSPINDCLGHPDGTLVDNIEDVDTVVGWLAESTRPHGFAISETQFTVFILNASRRLFSDRFFTSSFRPEFYTQFGVDWVNNNGPNGKVMEKGNPNGHEQEVSPLKRVLLRTMPELASELATVVNVFDPWARDRGEYYSLQWKPRPGAETDTAFRD
ncbi:MAG: peroxidase family protein [Nitrospirales bacterium]